MMNRQKELTFMRDLRRYKEKRMQHHPKELLRRFPLSMRPRWITTFLLAAFCALFTISKGGASAPPPLYARGHILVQFQEGISAPQRGQALSVIKSRGL